MQAADVQAPHLTFFVELDSEALEELFSRSEVIEFLVRGGHAVSMGLLDLSPARASIVRNLESQGVSVTAWLLLEEREGYWLNADNVDKARQRLRATVAWANEHGLRLPRIGLDIEFPRSDGELLMQDRRRGLWQLLKRRRPRARVDDAQQQYADLVREIRQQGRTVETYHFPQLLDERAVRSCLLRRTLGLVDVAVDAEVYMLYSSYLGRASIRLYFEEAQCIAIGVTGGGVHAGDPGERERLLSWEQLRDDLLAAARRCKNIYVFSLEGCVWRNLLTRIEAMDWAAPVQPLPVRAMQRASRARMLLRAVLRSERVLDWVLPARAEPRR